MDTMNRLEQADAVGFFRNVYALSELMEVGVLLAWVAVLLGAIAAARAAKRLLLDAGNGGSPAASEQCFLDDSDGWSSCSSLDDESEEELGTESEDTEGGTGDGEEAWRWSWSDFWETGRDGVVRSWEEESDGEGGEAWFEEATGLVSLWDRGRNEIVRSFENPPAALWEGGQLLRRRVVGLGGRGEDTLGRLRNAYAADLASIGRLSSTAATVVEDGRLEAAVVAWCRNAASCLPLFSPNK